MRFDHAAGPTTPSGPFVEPEVGRSGRVSPAGSRCTSAPFSRRSRSRSERRPNSVTSMRPSVDGDLGVVADEPGEPAGFDGRGEQDEVAAFAVGAEHLRGEADGVDGVVEAGFVVVELVRRVRRVRPGVGPSSHGDSTSSVTARRSVERCLHLRRAVPRRRGRRRCRWRRRRRGRVAGSTERERGGGVAGGLAAAAAESRRRRCTFWATPGMRRRGRGERRRRGGRSAAANAVRGVVEQVGGGLRSRRR